LFFFSLFRATFGKYADMLYYLLKTKFHLARLFYI